VAVCKAEIQKLATAALTADEKAQLNHLVRHRRIG